MERFRKDFPQILRLHRSGAAAHEGKAHVCPTAFNAYGNRLRQHGNDVHFAHLFRRHPLIQKRIKAVERLGLPCDLIRIRRSRHWPLRFIAVFIEKIDELRPLRRGFPHGPDPDAPEELRREARFRFFRGHIPFEPEIEIYGISSDAYAERRVQCEPHMRIEPLGEGRRNPRTHDGAFQRAQEIQMSEETDFLTFRDRQKQSFHGLHSPCDNLRAPPEEAGTRRTRCRDAAGSPRW